jgi:two-component system, OmpR family, response regulator MtrA
MAVTYNLLFASIGGSVESYLLGVLRDEGYHVTVADTPASMKEALAQQVDLLLFNLFATEELEAISTARASSSCAIIVLGPPRTAPLLISALERGADDYVQRPFRTDELLARIRARLRRVNRATATTLQFGALRVNTQDRTATVHDQEVDLSSFEFLLLLTLASHPGQVYRPSALLEQVWGARRALDVDLLLSAIHHLRQLIEREPGAPEILCGDLRRGYWVASSTPVTTFIK